MSTLSKKKPILSMSLLASNRKDTTKKCLDSLKMIMDRLDSELIIVDTGCDEEMQALLHEYTDQVIPFTWCNDFSKARNTGLDRCSGEWFLFIDDDEWFENVDEIVDFFRSGEYKKYDVANYTVRNYLDLEGKTYSDTWNTRMIRLQEDTRFCSSIHEYLAPVGPKLKCIHSYVHHYGYAFKTVEEKYRHSKRNVSLLLDMLQKERGNLRWWTQLVQEYSGIQEYGRLFDLCLEGIDLIKNEDHPYANTERGVFYAARIRSELAMFLLDEAKEDFERYIKDERNTSVCRAMLYSHGAEIYFRLGDHKRAKECAQKYVAEYEKWNGQPDREEILLREGGFFTREAYTTDTQVPVYCCLISCCLKEHDPSALKQYFDRLGWDEEVLKAGPLISRDILDAFAELDFDAEFPGIAQTLINRKEMTDSVIAYLMAAEEDGGDKYDRLLRIFAQVDSPNYYVWYMKLLYADQENELDRLLDAYRNLLGCVNDIFDLDDKIWEIADRRKLDLDPMFLQISFDQWKRGVDYFCEKTTLEQLKKIQEIVENAKKTPDIRYDYFEIKVKEAALVYGDGREHCEQLRKLLWDFCDISIRFYNRIYQPMAFQGEMEFLPESCRLAVRLKRVLDAEGQMTATETVQALETCLGTFVSLDASIRAYVRLYGEKEEERLNQMLEHRSLDQVAELVSAIGEAIEYLRTHPSPELQAGVQQYRKTVQDLLEQYAGDSEKQTFIELDTLSNEDWMLKVNEFLIQNGNKVKIAGVNI